MTVACLNAVGNLPSVKERLAMCAMISEKNGFTAYNEGGGYYIHGGRLSRRETKDPADPGDNMSSAGPQWSGKDRSVCTDVGKTRDMSLTDIC